MKDDGKKLLAAGATRSDEAVGVHIDSGNQDAEISGEGKTPYQLYQGVSATEEFFVLLNACVLKKENRDENIEALKALVRARRSEIQTVFGSTRGRRREGCCDCASHEFSSISPVRCVAEHADDPKNRDLLDFLLDNNFTWEYTDETLEPEYADQLTELLRNKLFESRGYIHATTGHTAKKRRSSSRRKSCCIVTLILGAVGVTFAGLGGAFSHK